MRVNLVNLKMHGNHILRPIGDVTRVACVLFLPHAVNCGRFCFDAFSLCFFVCVWNISETAERICAKFTRNTCSVPRSDKCEGQGQRSRSPGRDKNGIFLPFRRFACGNLPFVFTSCIMSQPGYIARQAESSGPRQMINSRQVSCVFDIVSSTHVNLRAKFDIGWHLKKYRSIGLYAIYSRRR